MTIWYVRNRLDQPKATIANQKRNKSLPPLSSSIVESFTRQTAATSKTKATTATTASAHHHNVKWLRMHVIALKLSHCWRLILYAIIISVISRTPPPVNGDNGAAAVRSSKMLPTAAASTWASNFFDADRIQCPSFVDNSACPCYKFEDGLQLECPRTTETALRTTLQIVKSPIQTLSLYDFDRTATSISSDMFVNGIHIRNLKFANTQLSMLKDNSLSYLRTMLETLAITNSKLNQIPRNALSGMEKLMELDFENNRISSIHDYNFYGLRLVKLNMKSNSLENIPEYAFAGLEDSLAEIDLSENKIKAFPLLALRKLERLRSLRLTSNEMSNMFKGNRSIRMPSLQYLFLDLNRFTEIEADAFAMFPNITTLSLFNNGIMQIADNAFDSLMALKSLDLSRNNIRHLDKNLFKSNLALHSCDLSNNHLHSIAGLFVGLPEIRDIFISDNNILDLPVDTFTNSTNIKMIYLENNAIRRVDENVFSTLTNLEQLYLGSNFITHIPQMLFNQTEKLISLSLDRNNIRDLKPGLFDVTKGLREIHLRYNKIRTIRKMVFYPLPELIELQLQNNTITTIEEDAFDSLKKLQHISLQQNQLTTLPRIFPADSTSLLSLEIDKNYIVDIQNETFQAMANVYVLWLNHNQLNKIDRTYFKDMPQLERLHLYNNQIVNIAVNTFNSMENLRYIDMHANRMQCVKRTLFTNLKSLEELNLASNEITEIQSKAFVNLKKLNRLDLSNNPIETLTRNTFAVDIAYLNLQNCSLTQINAGTFNGLHNLIELNLENNNLTLDIVQQLDVPSVRTLRLSHNIFTSIIENVFDKMPKLETLFMEYCNISHLPEMIFRHTLKLSRVDLSHNMLKTLEPTTFYGLINLKELHFRQNLFSELPYNALTNISTLETLSLSNNILTTFDFLKLNGMPNLRHLNADDNVISSINGFGAVNLSRLVSLDLSSNYLMDLPKNFLQNSNAIERIDLASNQFKYMPFVGSSSVISNSGGGSMEDALSQLNWLNLTGNPFASGIHDVENLETPSTTTRYIIPHLNELYITHTNLTAISSSDFDGYFTLQHLHLMQNRIERIASYAFKKLNNLLTLDISVNELERLPKECLHGLVQLRRLNLSTNRLRALDEFTIELAYLESLDISYNQLEHIDRNTLQNLHELRELRMAGNHIAAVVVDSFRFLNSLTLLDLRENQFRQIPTDVLNFLETHLQTLQLEHNPYNCSCESQSQWEWIKDHQKIMHSTERFIKCETPLSLRGRPFAAVTPEEFCPLITEVTIDDIERYSVVVSWQHREHTGLVGFEIFYQAIDGGVDDTELLPMHVNPFEHSAKLNVLSSGTLYRICVIGLGNRLSSAMTMYYVSNMVADNNLVNQFSDKLVSSSMDNPFGASEFGDDDENVLHTIENRTDAIYMEFRHGLMKSKIDTPISRCIEARTLVAEPVQITDENRLTDGGLLHSLLTRRLGLIVGCCLGIFVFIIIVSILGWLKLKKRRLENAKRHEQQLNQAEQLNYQHLNHPELNQTQLLPPPPDYNNTTYRQFTTLPYTDCDVRENCNQHLMHPAPPNCISVIGTTNIAC
ncbi:protein artichoke [Contarinia nasturtii]|uniref:protein artichoke n=1 Tax=Contarinia nasturtii TaxID=265458 RepID=UPI0012D4BF8D|nr:protein artichoke [Contarinia nasturtii]XP_031636563.1 protein artichoke [Contarinia nasturtii]XP_031636564.1 protein artichoke [Contarinia nasturtii]XP_031636565.1 protein artichoke [Contarinia nasturtii]